jgi:chitodextrinase
MYELNAISSDPDNDRAATRRTASKVSTMKFRTLLSVFNMAFPRPIPFLAAITSLLCWSSIHATAQSNQESPLGTNLASVSYFSSEQPFLNIFKTGGGWGTQNSSSGADTHEEVALYNNLLDSNGYPTTVQPGGSYRFNELEILLLNGLQTSSGSYPAGDYLMQWSGSASFTFGWDASVKCSSSPCKVTVSSPAGGLAVFLTCTGNDSGCPGGPHGTNFSFIYCGSWNGSSCSNGADTQLASCNSGTLTSCFNPTFLNRIKPFRVLRFMDWMAANSNFQTNWSDRPLPNWVFWDDSRTNATINGADPRSAQVGINDGVPAEIMFALCNAVQADCWFNMPPLGTDTYVTNFANLALSNLDSNIRVYVEYANEVWNSHFAPQQGGSVPTAPLNNASVFSQLAAAGAAIYPNVSGYSAVWQYGEALRPVQVGHDWKVAWGSQSGRVIRVAGSQAANTYIAQAVLSSLPDGSDTCCGIGSRGGPTYWYGSTGGTVAQNVDVLAIAPYFGYTVPDTTTLDQLFQEILSGGAVSGGYPGGMIKQALDWAASNYNIAQAAGVALVAYEAGQTLVDYTNSDTALQNLYAAANRDPRMGTAYTALLNGWKTLGGTLLNNYNDIETFSVSGYWGALENVLQTSSPRYDALVNFASANPCWWSGCSSSSAGPSGSSTTPPSVPTGLAGTVGSATQINLSWTASTDNAGVAGYNVFRSGAKVGSTSATSYQDTGLSAGTNYSYAVSAYDAAGNTSAQSSSISVTTPAPPAVAITSPANGTLLKGNSGIKVAVTAMASSGIASITIMAGTTPVMTCTNTTSCSGVLSSTGLSQGTHVISATATDKLGLKTSTSITFLALK